MRGFGEVLALAIGRVEWVEVIERHDGAAVGEQAVDEAGADESGPPGDERGHASPIGGEFSQVVHLIR